MDTQITLKTVENNDFSALIELGKSYYPENHPALNKDFLNWYYLNNPDGKARLVIAYEAELWIGIIVLIPINLEYSSKEQQACYAINVLTHPEHRTKNLFIKMIRYAKPLLEKENIWLLGHPNANAIPGWKRQKMQFRKPLQLYMNKPVIFSNLRRQRVTSLEQLTHIPTEFWSKCAERTDVHAKYSPEFIAWKYLKAPHRQYRVITVYKKEDLIGIIITRHFKYGVDLMVDFIASDISHYCSLLRCVYRPTLLMFPEDNPAYHEILKACWKLPVKREFPFFASTWIKDDNLDMSGITLAASDF